MLTQGRHRAKTEYHYFNRFTGNRELFNPIYIIMTFLVNYFYQAPKGVRPVTVLEIQVFSKQTYAATYFCIISLTLAFFAAFQSYLVVATGSV
jgi:hypothetical protein